MNNEIECFKNLRTAHPCTPLTCVCRSPVYARRSNSLGGDFASIKIIRLTCGAECLKCARSVKMECIDFMVIKVDCRSRIYTQNSRAESVSPATSVCP
jgi:hypothetical protein